MFCPQCGTHNDVQQRFCRQCGQPLATVRLVLDGSADEAIAKFRKGSDSVVGGLFTFCIFFVIALGAFFIGGPWNSLINIVLGLIFSLPFIIKGTRRLREAERMLDEQQTTGAPSLLAPPVRAAIHAPATTDPIDARPSLPNSVTEHTTLELTRPEQKPRRGAV